MAEYPPWPPPVASVTYRLRSNTSYFRSPLTGATQVTTKPGGRWEFDVQLMEMDDIILRQWIAFLAYVQEEGLTFYWNHYPKARPYAYPQGTDAGGTPPWGSPVVNGASQSGRTLVVSGLAAGATFYMGDALAFDNGIYREMHEIKADVTADGTGAATFPITPAIRTSPPNGNPILFDGHATDPTKRCACEVIFADPAQAAVQLRNFQMDAAFKLIEMTR